MLIICKSEAEKKYSVSLAQENIEEDAITKSILTIYDTYASDKRYTKRLCVNSNRLTIFGLRNFDPNGYVKIPLITVTTTVDGALAGLTFNAEEYIFVKEKDYLNMCKKHFKNVIFNTITVLNIIAARNQLKLGFDYTKRKLLLLLTDIDVLKQVKDII